MYLSLKQTFHWCFWYLFISHLKLLVFCLMTFLIFHVILVFCLMFLSLRKMADIKFSLHFHCIRCSETKRKLLCTLYNIRNFMSSSNITLLYLFSHCLFPYTACFLWCHALYCLFIVGILIISHAEIDDNSFLFITSE